MNKSHPIKNWKLEKTGSLILHLLALTFNLWPDVPRIRAVISQPAEDDEQTGFWQNSTAVLLDLVVVILLILKM